MRILSAVTVLAALMSCGPPGLGTLTTSQPAKVRRTKAIAGSGSAKTTNRCARVLPFMERLSDEHGVDLSLVAGIVRVESRFNPRARSRSGAMGLMQVMPSTGRWFKCGSLADPEDNLKCGIRVLKRYLSRYDGNLTYGIAAYNSGPRSADRYRRAGILPKNYSYVEKVLAARNRFVLRGCE